MVKKCKGRFYFYIRNRVQSKLAKTTQNLKHKSK